MTTSPAHVVVPLDGSKGAERALPIADQLAQRGEMPMLLVSARFGPDDGTTIGYLTRIASTLSPPPAVRVIEDRHAPNAILDVAGANPRNLVVMAAHARGSVGRALLGSVTEEVVCQSVQPVAVVGPSTDPDWSIHSGHVVVCTDASPHADSIVPAVAGLLHQLHLDSATVVLVGAHPNVDSAGALAGVLTEHGLTATSKLLSGDDPADAIVAYVRDTRPALIVLATHGRTGSASVSFGSVTTGVCRQAPCPVLVARPRALARAG